MRHRTDTKYLIVRLIIAHWEVERGKLKLSKISDGFYSMSYRKQPR